MAPPRKTATAVAVAVFVAERCPAIAFTASAAGAVRPVGHVGGGQGASDTGVSYMPDVPRGGPGRGQV